MSKEKSDRSGWQIPPPKFTFPPMMVSYEGPKKEVPLRASQTALDLHAKIFLCLEQRQHLWEEAEKCERDNPIASKIFNVWENIKSDEIADLLLEAMKSEDRKYFMGHMEILMPAYLSLKKMTAEQLVAGFESGELHDF